MLRLSEALDYGTIATKREAPHHLALPVGRGEVSRAVAPPGSKNPGKAFPFQNLGKFTQGLPQHVVSLNWDWPSPENGGGLPRKPEVLVAEIKKRLLKAWDLPWVWFFTGSGCSLHGYWVAPKGADNHRQPPGTDFAAPGGSTWG